MRFFRKLLKETALLTIGRNNKPKDEDIESRIQHKRERNRRILRYGEKQDRCVACRANSPVWDYQKIWERYF